ncbi:MAG: SCO family protein [Acidimicrobiales bacterium]
MTAPTVPSSASDDRGLMTPTPSPSRRRTRARQLALLLGAIVVGIALGIFALRTFRPHLYAGTVLQGDTPAPSMSGLTLSNGEPVDLATFDGELVLVYFGYANCPDICPTTLSTAAKAVESLDEDDQDRTQLLMVSVDPERDSLEYLGTYTSFFHPRFMGATGAVDDVDRVASQYGIFYQFGEGEDYTVDHTASLMGIDPDGVLRILWSPEVTSEQLAADISQLLG